MDLSDEKMAGAGFVDEQCAKMAGRVGIASMTLDIFLAARRRQRSLILPLQSMQ